MRIRRQERQELFFSGGGRAARRVKLGLAANGEFFVALGVFTLLTLLASRTWNFQTDFELYSTPFAYFGAGIVVLLFSVLSLQMIVWDRPKRPLRHLWHIKLGTDWGIPERLCIGFPVALALPIFFSLFSSVKASIGSIVPFYADPLLASADHVLLGGDAWRVLQLIIGLPLITFVLNFFYNSWFGVTMASLFCMTFMKEDLKLRHQYLVAFVLIWAVLGNVVAVAFSSVGPCFYQAFYGSPRYADLMTYLQSANQTFPIWSLTAQKYLLSSMSGVHPGAGISAFPSMHVAEAMLNVMLCRHFRRIWQVASVAFLLLIFVGSIALGWHYAVDGLASIVAVPVLWWLAGKFSLAPLFESAIWRRGAAAADVPMTGAQAPVVPK